MVRLQRILLGSYGWNPLRVWNPLHDLLTTLNRSNLMVRTPIREYFGSTSPDHYLRSLEQVFFIEL